MKHLIASIFLALLTVGIACAQVPVISSFAPLAGPVGSNITISGSNFSPIVANSTVYFGSMRATVTAATATSLSVTVPVGAGYAPISVSRDTLTTFSARPFTVTFAGGIGASMVPNSFAAQQSLAPVTRPCLADFDNDGLLDMVAATGSNGMAVYRNLGSPTEFVLSAPLFVSTNNQSFQVVAADFTGDGKLDMAVVFTSNAGISIYKNSSTAGNIAFEAPVSWSTGFEATYSVAAADVDGNGKTDLVVGYAGATSRAFSVGRNIGTGNALAFAPAVHINYGISISTTNVRVVTTDLDGNNRVDVALVSSISEEISLFRNTSTPGTISFAARQGIAARQPSFLTDGRYDLEVVDMDGDGRRDLVFAHEDSAQLSLFRNTSTVGSISFAARTAVAAPAPPVLLAPADFDGDGKPDIAAIPLQDSVMVFKNVSTTGSFSFQPVRRFPIAYFMSHITADDMDADGKTDMIVSGIDVNNNNARSCFVLRNQINSPVITSFTPPTAGKDTVVLIRGDRFANTTGVQFGTTPAASFTVLSDTVLQAVVSSGTSGNVWVTTATGLNKLGGFRFTLPVPQITAVVPQVGPVGSSVTVRGKNFNPNATGNTVYFGSVRGTVTAATDTALTVTVPTGVSYRPVTVHNGNQLSAASATPFLVTFDGSDAAFSNNSIGTAQQLQMGDNFPRRPMLADFDGDGKTDIAAANTFNTNRVSVFRNTGMDTVVAFAPRQDYLTFTGSFGGGSGGTVDMETADMDGDGLTDMVAVSSARDSLSVFRNISTPGNIGFAAKRDFGATREPLRVNLGDLDGDGKPDAVVSVVSVLGFSSYPGFYIYKNNSTVGNIALQRGDSCYVAQPHGMELKDMDGDGKLDVVAPVSGTGRILFYRNTSVMGRIKLADSVSFVPGFAFGDVLVEDVDMDGKPDLLLMRFLAPSQFAVFRNVSTPGNIAFANRVDYPMPRRVFGSGFGDLSGDGRPDFFQLTDSSFWVVLHKNISTGTAIQFAPPVLLNRTFNPGFVTAGDVTGDGKPDLVTSPWSSFVIEVLRNKVGEPVNTGLCPAVDSVLLQAGIAAATYQWQVDTGSGFADIGNNSNYIGANTASLRIRNIPAAWYGYRYRCVTNAGNSDVYNLNVQSRWIGSVNNNWENPANWSCGRVPNANSDVFINSGTVVVNSNVTIRTLRVATGVSFTVNSGFGLTVLR